MRSAFIPIPIEAYVQKHLSSNRGVDRKDLVRRLQYALAASRSGSRCECGNPIWVIGSAEVGLRCFTCITGEANPSGDYEIDEAIGG
ncbi:MAG TPA: hypothetical protein VFD07_04370 [Candidatus Krumholzibacteria bacterium]|nr:hypothetical protein [Candidatus Krumholzibacteria bacterium]